MNPQDPQETPPGPTPDPGSGTPQPTPVDPAQHGVPPETPAAPAPTASEIAREIGRELASSLGENMRRPETPQPQQRRMSLREQIDALPPDKRAELDAKVAIGGISAAMEVAQAIAAEQVADVRAQAQPLVGATGSLLVDSYMARKAESDSYYKQIADTFRKRMASQDKSSLVNLPDAQRDMLLDTIWDAAAGQVFRNAAAAAPARTTAPTLTGGGGAGSPSAPGRSADDDFIDNDPFVSALIAEQRRRGNLNDDDVKDIKSSYRETWVPGA